MSRLGQFTLVPVGIGSMLWTRIAAAVKLLWQRPGVRWRVVLLSLLIPLVCANAAFIWQDYHLRRYAIVAEHHRESARISDELDDFLHTIQGVTQLLASRWVRMYQGIPTNPEILDAQESYLMDLVDNRQQFSRGFITDSTGIIKISSDSSLAGKRLGPATLYQQAYQDQAFIVSDAIVPSGYQKPFVLFVQPLTWNGDQPEGFMVLQAELETISETLGLSAYLSSGIKVTVLDSQARIIARSDYQTPQPGVKVTLGADVSDSDFWKQAATHPAEEQYGMGLSGSNRVIFFTYPESTPWITAISYDQTEIFDPLGYRLWVLIGALTVSVGAAIWVGEVWIRRERRMVSALEERVEERTTELSETNNTLRNEIAERVKAEGALRKSEEQQKALVTAIPDLILQISKDGVIQSAKLSNSLPEHWASDVRQGKGIDQLLSPDISRLYLDYIHRALQTGDIQLFEHELQIGSEMLNWEARLVVNGEDEVVAIIRDITKQRELEKQFLLSQKMESVGRLAGGIAHEFNNLLAAIIGFSSLALENSTSGKTKDYLQHSLKASERAAGLVQQLLTFARSKNSEPSDFDLNELIIETDNLLRRIIGEDIELVILPSPDLKLIKADRSQIQQVLLNLATNAHDAMPEGGKLIIETSNVVLNHSQGMDQAGAFPGKYVALTATDTGIGMNDEIKAHIFEPFFTTKEVGKGTGLGLSICYGIVTQNGGYVEVESALKEGSRFRIYLPQADAKEPVNPSESISEAGGSLWGAETVLLVEDEPVVLNLTSHVLRQQGYTVLEAANGVDALSIAQEHIIGGGQIHLALADVVMPQMGGKELVERLMKMFPDIKALFMSGYIQGVTPHIDILGSEVELIQKPFTPNALLSKVRETLAGVNHSRPHVYS